MHISCSYLAPQPHLLLSCDWLSRDPYAYGEEPYGYDRPGYGGGAAAAYDRAAPITDRCFSWHTASLQGCWCTVQSLLPALLRKHFCA